MNALYYLFFFLLALAPLVIFHELGHFWVARLCGVKVLRFSVGFGKPIFSWIRGPDKTEWVVAMIPLGGYVKMLDEREGLVPHEDLSRAFNRQTLFKRAAIVAAGPVANLLVAVLIYCVLFMHGIPGFRAIVAENKAQSAAALAGFKKADQLIAVDQIPTPTWQEVRWELLKKAVKKQTVEVSVLTESNQSALRRLDLSGLDKESLQGNFIQDLGLSRFLPLGAPEIVALSEQGSAKRFGLQVGDVLLKIDDQMIQSPEQATQIIRHNANHALQVVVKRSSAKAELTFTLTPDPFADPKTGQTVGRMGAALQPEQALLAPYQVLQRYGPLDSLYEATLKTWDTALFSVQMMGKMLLGQVSLKNISGPISIADYAGQSAQMGWMAFCHFLAIISISLGILNLMPIPVLDGGHLLYYIVEFIKGSPVPLRIVEIGQKVGLFFLISLMILALFNDVNRLLIG